MKKRVTAVLLAVLAIVLAAAAFMYFNPTPARLIGRMARNLEKVSSVEAEVSAEYEGSVTVRVLGMPVETSLMINTDLDVEAVTQPAAAHIEGRVGGTVYKFSADTPLECYVREEDGGSAAYMSTDSAHWIRHMTKESGNESSLNGSDGKLVLGLIQKILSGEIKADLAKETVTICGQEAYRISIGISGDILQQIVEIIYSSGNAVNIPEGLDVRDAGTKCELYIYKKKNLPARLTIDCAPLGNAVMQSLLGKQDLAGAADRFTVTATFTGYNTIDSIEVPEEVVSSAVESPESLLGILIPGL